MIYPDVDPKEFKKKYGLVEYDWICCKCNNTFTVNRPYLTKDYAGLCSEIHEPCGSRYVALANVPRSKVKMNSWKRIIAELTIAIGEKYRGETK